MEPNDNILQLPQTFLDFASEFMAFVHTSVNEACRIMQRVDGRYAYTTPRSYLEQVQLFDRLLTKQMELSKAKVERLENGLERLRFAALQVDDLKKELAVQEIELKYKTEKAENLIKVIFN